MSETQTAPVETRPEPQAAPAETKPQTPARRGSYAVAALFFCLGALALSAPWTLGFYTIPWDAKGGAYPQIAFLARALAEGDLPFWAPGVFAGHPQIADPQSLIFSPPFLLLAWLVPKPGFQAVDATVFALLALAGLALIAFFRDRGWRAEGALVAAFAFAFGGSNVWRLQHIGEVLSLCWFAIALFFWAQALERRSLVWGLFAGFAAGFMVLGRDQIAMLCVWLLILFTVWHVVGRGLVARLRAALKPILAGLFGGIVVAAIPLAFSVALAMQSNRASIDYAGAARGSLSPLALLTAVVSNLYGVDGPNMDFWGPPSSLVWGENDFILARNMGAIYFGALPFVALVCVGLVRGAFLRREIWFYVSGAFLMGVYALGSHTPFFRYAYFIPGVDLFRRPADATFPLCAMLAILAGYCVHRLFEESWSGWRRRALDITGAAFVLFALMYCAHIAIDRGRLGQASFFLIVGLVSLGVALLLMRWARGQGGGLKVMAAFALLMTADLAFSNKPNESTALSPDVYDAVRFESKNETIALIKKKLAEFSAPDRRDRVELAAIGYDWPNAGLVHGFDHDLGFNPVRLKLFSDATGAIDQIAIKEQRKFSPLYANFKSPMMDLLGVRILATGVPPEEMDKSFKSEHFPLIARTKDAFVYENPRALPRVLFASEAKKADFAVMIRDGGWPEVDFRKTVLLESADQAAREPGVARIISYKNTEVVIEADSPQGGWVVLNDVFHPWWRAEVGGAAAEIARANVMFRAVAVPQGKHVVTFRFAPFSGLVAQMTGR